MAGLPSTPFSFKRAYGVQSAITLIFYLRLTLLLKANFPNSTNSMRRSPRTSYVPGPIEIELSKMWFLPSRSSQNRGIGI